MDVFRGEPPQLSNIYNADYFWTDLLYQRTDLQVNKNMDITWHSE